MYEQPFIPQLHRWKELLYIEESYCLTITKNTTTKQLFQTGITPTLLHLGHSKANTSPTNVVEEGVISKFKSS